jgi:hypothetical protein
VSLPLIFAWAEAKKVRLQPELRYVAYVMAEDGSPLGQIGVQSIEWAKAATGAVGATRHDVYLAEYPLGFEVVWLDAPRHDGRWWQAKFFRGAKWEISFLSDQGISYVEFRDARTRAVRGHVVHLAALDHYYVVPGRATPRRGDIYPGQPMVLWVAMEEAHLQFMQAA